MSLITASLSKAHQRILVRARAKRAERQREAATELFLDDLRGGFASQAAIDQFAAQDEYKSAISEDWPNDY